jgi:hypothetical protein
MHTAIFCGHLKERDDLEDLGINERKILKWILKEREINLLLWQTASLCRCTSFSGVKFQL